MGIGFFPPRPGSSSPAPAGGDCIELATEADLAAFLSGSVYTLPGPALYCVAPQSDLVLTAGRRIECQAGVVLRGGAGTLVGDFDDQAILAPATTTAPFECQFLNVDNVSATGNAGTCCLRSDSGFPTVWGGQWACSGQGGQARCFRFNGGTSRISGVNIVASPTFAYFTQGVEARVEINNMSILPDALGEGVAEIDGCQFHRLSGLFAPNQSIAAGNAYTVDWSTFCIEFSLKNFFFGGFGGNGIEFAAGSACRVARVTDGQFVGQAGDGITRTGGALPAKGFNIRDVTFNAVGGTEINGIPPATLPNFERGNVDNSNTQMTETAIAP